jgi:hypothetical protein
MAVKAIRIRTFFQFTYEKYLEMRISNRLWHDQSNGPAKECFQSLRKIDK